MFLVVSLTSLSNEPQPWHSPHDRLLRPLNAHKRKHETHPCNHTDWLRKITGTGMCNTALGIRALPQHMSATARLRACLHCNKEARACAHARAASLYDMHPPCSLQHALSAGRQRDSEGRQQRPRRRVAGLQLPHLPKPSQEMRLSLFAGNPLFGSPEKPKETSELDALSLRHPQKEHLKLGRRTAQPMTSLESQP